MGCGFADSFDELNCFYVFHARSLDLSDSILEELKARHS